MKIKYIVIALFLIIFAAEPVMAQSQGGNLLSQGSEAWRRSEAELQEETDEELSITPRMQDEIPFHALKNIRQAEQVFCYHVQSPDEDFEGYTIDGMAISGFCGVLEPNEIQFFIDEFLSKDQNVSNIVARCLITPRIMLRFVNGVDYTDVLFSSPCESFSVFYGGSVETFNLSPATELVQQYIENYEKRKMDFISPALLKQVLPIGIPQNEEQRLLVREKNTPKPVRKWVTDQEKSAPQETAPAQPKSGWNKLKFSK